jgi:uncharacterized lipoprotein
MKNVMKLIISVALLIGSAGCASWLPDDPFMAAKSDKPIRVPEGMEMPASDPNLTIPSGDDVAVIKGGHLPPKPQNPTAITEELPTQSEDADPEDAGNEVEKK